MLVIRSETGKIIYEIKGIQTPGAILNRPGETPYDRRLGPSDRAASDGDPVHRGPQHRPGDSDSGDDTEGMAAQIPNLPWLFQADRVCAPKGIDGSLI